MNTKLITTLPVFSEEEETEMVTEKQLGYFAKPRTQYQYTVNIDEPFVQPSYYRGVVQMLMDAHEDDVVIFMCNSPGGYLSGLQSLLEAIKMTEATTIAVLVGQVASAASIFALHCDQIFVTDSANLLAHNISYGTGGKGSDILSHVQHVSKTSEKLLRKTYEHFLSKTEIDEMINGREIYLDSDEIKQRLEQKEKALEALEQAVEEAPTKKPRKPRNKKTETTTES